MEQSPGPSWKTIVVGVILLAAIAFLYLAGAQRWNWWPYEVDQTANWQTYQNPDYGFTVKHPENWHAEECRDSGPGGIYVLASLGDAEDLVICNSDAPIQGIVNINAAPEGGVGVNIEQEIASTIANLDNARKTNTTVDGQSAIRVEGTTRQLEGPSAPAGMRLILIYISKNGNTYRLFYLNTPERADEFEQVAKTFKFGNSNVPATGEIYKNEQYGFQIPLTTSWEGYKETVEQWEGRDVATGRVSEHGPLIKLRHPSWTAANPHEDMPIMVFTPAQWALIEQEKLSVGAAPIAPSELGRNAEYIFALPARYNYDFATGFEEVDELVHRLQAFDPRS